VRPLEIDHLGFAYDDGTVALEDISFALEEGEKLAVVGPNGAGKSTLLHLVAGFRMPFSGDVIINGIPLKEPNADSLRRHVGLLFQDPDDQLFMPTVEEDVAFGPRNLGLDDIDSRVLKALRSCGIEHLATRRPHNLSFGMKKRAAIAGILSMEPDILLLDEPTSGLDPRSRSELVALLKRMDKTMMIATHDIEAAAEVAQKVIVLNTSVAMQGTMPELLRSKDILEHSGLEMPSISKLFAVLESMGYDVDSLPTSVDQATAQLTKVIEAEGKHVHAHIHERDRRGDEKRYDRGHRNA
jgi:cobalt/nickel transport system ATP-binding protein